MNTKNLVLYRYKYTPKGREVVFLTNKYSETFEIQQAKLFSSEELTNLSDDIQDTYIAGLYSKFNTKLASIEFARGSVIR